MDLLFGKSFTGQSESVGIMPTERFSSIQNLLVIISSQQSPKTVYR
jgi:hypothetical protein